MAWKLVQRASEADANENDKKDIKELHPKGVHYGYIDTYTIGTPAFVFRRRAGCFDGNIIVLFAQR